ncbi:MAG: peptidoglycan recognition protein family protein, partial [Actinomycetota bacterium]
MPSPRIRLVVLRALAAAVAAGSVLGLFPPALGREVPPTVIRRVGLDTSALVPPRSAPTLRPDGAIRPGRTAWSPREVVCSPIRFTTVGVVWRQDGGAGIPARMAFGDPGRFRNRIEVEGEPAEGPDPGSADDSGLQGTPPVWTGEARCLRLRIRLPAGQAVGDVRAVFVNTSGTAEPPSFLDRAVDVLARVWGMTTEPFAVEPAEAAVGQPAIIPRSGWGAKEKLRRCGPDYSEDGVKMAYVHHTVNSNGYARSRSDDLIRGIYAYHVQGRRFCDIAYNFLIDRFGRVFEGRFGGIDQPVIGAHAMGFNTGSTGVAALGTFTSTKAPARMLRAFKRLLAWRLDVAHVRPTGKAVMTSAGGP